MDWLYKLGALSALYLHLNTASMWQNNFVCIKCSLTFSFVSSVCFGSKGSKRLDKIVFIRLSCQISVSCKLCIYFHFVDLKTEVWNEWTYLRWGSKLAQPAWIKTQHFFLCYGCLFKGPDWASFVYSIEQLGKVQRNSSFFCSLLSRICHSHQQQKTKVF